MLGRGGMGAVYEVVGRGGRRYALKVLQPTSQDREERAAQVRRMLDEGTVMVGIKHPNIVEVHEHGEHKGLVYMLMELIDGETLRARLHRDGPLPVARACSFLRSAGYAAEQCHVLAIVHRDIKPENFMVSRDHQLKMLDLGIAQIVRSTVTQSPIGTPAYMAPEQFNTRLKTTYATDVYALGLMGYELLAGYHPFLYDDAGKERTPWELCFEQSFTSPQPLAELGVPAPIAEVIARATTKDPRERFPSGGAFAEAIWSAWKEWRDQAASGDEEAGKVLASAPEELRFGTGPMGATTGEAMRQAARAGSTSGSSAGTPAPSPQPPRRPAQLRSEPLPEEMSDPANVEAFLSQPRTGQGAGGSAAAGGRGRTLRLPDRLRDPTCIAAERGRLGPGGTAPLADVVTAPTAWAPEEPPRREPPAGGEVSRVAPARAGRRERLVIGVGLANAVLLAAVLALLAAVLAVFWLPERREAPAPVAAPAPVSEPVPAPVPASVAAPVAAPVSEPVAAPVAAPVPASVAEPVAEPVAGRAAASARPAGGPVSRPRAPAASKAPQPAPSEIVDPWKPRSPAVRPAPAPTRPPRPF
jgi:serine/threonine-protein kinase